MVPEEYTAKSSNGQIAHSIRECAAVLSNIDDTALVERLEAYHPVGRKGYPVRSLFRAFVCGKLLNIESTNELIRQLEDRPDFRMICGFTTIPHRTVFSRFFGRLCNHPDLVAAAVAGITNKVKAFLPDLGVEVAVDSTVVTSNSRPRRKNNKGVVLKESSDPEAHWTAKNSARAKEGGKDWFWGYKVHMVVDVNHGLPIAQFVTPANRNDSPELPNLINYAEALHDWFKPDVVIADRGYDGLPNHQFLIGKGIRPIIQIKKKAHDELYEGIYTKEGVPTCIGKVPMEYIRTDPKSGHLLYRCGGCHLKNSFRGGIRHCDTEVWEDPMARLRLQGVLRRESPEWKALYAKRQGIERLFKTMKESNSLNAHYFRGLRKVTMHAILSALARQGQALVKLQGGRTEELRWARRPVDYWRPQSKSA